jgi:predicted permease
MLPISCTGSQTGPGIPIPAAQNLFTYASSYRVGEKLAREAILVSTVLSVPVLVVVAALLG